MIVPVTKAVAEHYFYAPPETDAEQAQADRCWNRLEYVYGYGPHGLCDVCEQPLETLGDLNTGRCAPCALLHGTPAQPPYNFYEDESAW